MPEPTERVARRIEFVTRVEARTGSVAGRSVLDLGCGRDALWTRAYTARGARVVALEIDAERAHEAAARLAAAGSDGATRPRGGALGVIRGDGERLPFAAASFAFVHCAQVLEHVRSPRAFLDEVRRVLEPGGHAYVTAINRYALRDPHFGVRGVNYLPRGLADRVLDWLGAVNPEGQTLAAMHYFSRPGFRRLCAASGLELVMDLKREERLARRGALGGRVADLWGVVHGAAFHTLVRRPDGGARPNA